MYKMIKVFNVIQEQNEVKSADYEVVAQLNTFELGDSQIKILENICIDNNIPYGSYSIVEYEGEKPIAVVGQFFYHSGEDKEKGLETFLDCAEWNERVYASVALGVDLVLT